jgi:hypothetical protein
MCTTGTIGHMNDPAAIITAHCMLLSFPKAISKLYASVLHLLSRPHNQLLHTNPECVKGLRLTPLDEGGLHPDLGQQRCKVCRETGGC